MFDSSIERPWPAIVTVSPYAGPVLRHGGWFVFFVLLAPLIGPRDYGLFIYAFSGVAMLEVLLTVPARCAIEAAAALDERHWSTALTTMMVLGTTLSAGVFSSSGVVGGVVGEDGFGDLVRSLSPLPLLGALAVVPQAALRREKREGATLAAGAAGVAAGGGVALAFAWSGAGAWSLVAQIVVQRLVECASLLLLPSGKIGIAWSQPHFIDLLRGLDCSTIAAAARVAMQYAALLSVGWVLGPTAAGLYMLASRLAHLCADVFLPADPRPRPADAARRATRVVLPALLGSTLLPIALPSIVDLRWWGAVLPAQLLLLACMPAAVGFVRAACDAASEWRWQTVEVLGTVAAVALAARYGLTSIALAEVGSAFAIALASLAPIRRALAAEWAALLTATIRPIAGAAAAGLLLYLLADPLGLALAPVPALCLLIASGWLLYLVIRGGAVATRPQSSVRPASSLAEG